MFNGIIYNFGIIKKIKKAKSDSAPIPNSLKELEKKPEALNLLTIYSEISKITKTLIFQWFFAKNEKFYKFTSRWLEKKFSEMVQMTQKMSLRPFFRMPR